MKTLLNKAFKKFALSLQAFLEVHIVFLNSSHYVESSDEEDEDDDSDEDW